MKKRVLIATATMVLVAVIAVTAVPRLRTEAFVALYHGDIERMIAADGSVPADDATLFGYRSVDSWDRDGHCITEFMIGARGFLLVNARYFGCFYSPDDKPAAFQNTDEELIQDGENRWTWQGEGDNCGVVEKIRDRWYYFEAEF